MAISVQIISENPWIVSVSIISKVLWVVPVSVLIGGELWCSAMSHSQRSYFAALLKYNRPPACYPITKFYPLNRYFHRLDCLLVYLFISCFPNWNVSSM